MVTARTAMATASPHRSTGRARRRLRTEFRRRHLWARRYFVCTSGNVTDCALRRAVYGVLRGGG